MNKEDLATIKELGYEVEDVEAMDNPPYKSDVEGKIKWNEFCRGLKEIDFTPGDIFWLNGVEFEVKRTIIIGDDE